MDADFIREIQERHKYPLALAIREFESPLVAARKFRLKLMQAMAGRPSGRVVGVTGTPGAGKSSLLGRLALHILEHTNLSMAILAVDPTSLVSGGSLLGDRTRTNLPGRETRLFFRSQPSQLSLGGLGRHSYSVVRLLRKVFDIVAVETVGIGQNETEIRQLADLVYLVMQPLAGDQIQFIKSGIMEIPDVFVINKCDEEKLAIRAMHSLEAGLSFNAGVSGADLPPVFLTSTVTGRGIAELAASFTDLPSYPAPNRSAWFLRKSVQARFGEWGCEQVARELDDLEKTGLSDDAYELEEDRLFATIEKRL